RVNASRRSSSVSSWRTVPPRAGLEVLIAEDLSSGGVATGSDKCRRPRHRARPHVSSPPPTKNRVDTRHHVLSRSGAARSEDGVRDASLAAWLRDADEGAADGDGVLGGVATAGAGDLFEPGDGAPPRDRSPRLLLLAVLPWAVVVVLAAALVVRVRVEASPSAAPPAPTPAPAVDTSPSPAAAEGAARAAAVL